jgi:hypothetical protein
MVLGDQHAPLRGRVVARACGIARRRRFVLLRRQRGQADPEYAAAAATFASRLDRPGVQLDEAFRDREADAEPPATRPA